VTLVHQGSDAVVHAIHRSALAIALLLVILFSNFALQAVDMVTNTKDVTNVAYAKLDAILCMTYERRPAQLEALPYF